MPIISSMGKTYFFWSVSVTHQKGKHMAGQLDLQVSALSHLVSIGQSKLQALGRAVGVGAAGALAATPIF